MITTDELLAMPNRAFRTVITEDLKDGERDPDLHNALRSPQVVHRWLTSLLQMAKSADGTLAAREADYESQRSLLRIQLKKDQQALQGAHGDRKYALQRKISQAEQKFEEIRSAHLVQRAKTLRFKTGVEEAIIEARSLMEARRDRLYDSVVAEERNRYATRNRELEDAIGLHRRRALGIEDDHMDDDEIDQALWDVLVEDFDPLEGDEDD